MIKERIAKLIDVKSIVTITMTFAMIGLLFSNKSIPQEILVIFSTAYGSVITYFFTKKEKESE